MRFDPDVLFSRWHYLLGLKGEVITCQDGHPTYELTEDIRIGDILTSDCFKCINPKMDGIFEFCHCGNRALHSFERRRKLLYGPNGVAIHKIFMLRNGRSTDD
jgi:hypothetical protein